MQANTSCATIPGF